jgi:Na+/H+-dicarboxylate symporter
MSNATRILVALILGLGLGLLASSFAPVLGNDIANVADPVGALWLNGLRMTIVPLVVALLITGIAQTAEAARAGAVAGRAMLWIVCVMCSSAVLGAILMPSFLTLVPMPQAAADALKGALTTTGTITPPPPFVDFVKSIVPTNPIAAAAGDGILPLLVFTLVFAFAITRLPPEPRSLLSRFFAAISDAMVIVIDWVLRLAPIGVFALAFVVGARSGLAALGALFHYVASVASVGIVMSLIAYLVAVFAARWRFGDYARAVAPVQALAISTQSSLACLPIMLKKSQQLGVQPATAEITLPMAVALLRATGPAMNLAVALYVANWYGVDLTAGQYAVAIFAAVLTSMGAVSLPGQVSFVTSIGPLCLILGVPVEPLALLIAVETLPDIFRTLGNVMWDVAVTGAVARQSDTMEKPA